MNVTSPSASRATPVGTRAWIPGFNARRKSQHGGHSEYTCESTDLYLRGFLLNAIVEYTGDDRVSSDSS